MTRQSDKDFKIVRRVADRPVPERQRLVTMVSEMPYLALSWLAGKDSSSWVSRKIAQPEYSVQKFKTPPRIKSGVVVYETWGKTEAKVKNGSVDFGLEITQSGSAIRNYGLRSSTRSCGPRRACGSIRS